MNSLTQMNQLRPLARMAAAAPAPTADAAPRTEMAGTACPNLTKCQRIGNIDPNQQMQVSVILNRPKELNLPTGAFKPMTREGMSKYAATSTQINGVQKFAKQFGLKIGDVDPQTRTVKLTGPASSFGKAFSVQMGQYKDAQGNEFRGYQGNIKLPSDLAGSVSGVFGLENRPFAQSHKMMQPKDDSGNISYDPTQVAAKYNFPQNTDGTGQTIGIIELGGGYNESDLQQYFQKLGIKEPSVKAVSVDGGSNAPTNDPNGPDGEVALDLDVAGAVAPGAKIVVYFAPNTEQGFIDAVNQAAHDKDNKPGSLSISWGTAESNWTPQGLTNFNNALKDAAAAGVNVFVAAGDNGSTDGQSDGANHADFPASSPYSIGCGGTQLNSNSEVAWNDGDGGGSSGGGVSGAFPTPDYQKNSGVPAPATAGGGRGVPDVSGDASPTTGYNVLVDGQSAVIGGTSAVAPLWAGLAARLGQGAGQQLPFLNPIMYQPNVASTFNDITSGNNGGFQAGPGWDPVTGLGSPNGDKLLAAIKNALQNPTSSFNSVG